MKRGHQLGLSLQMFLAQHPTIILILYILLSLSLSLSLCTAFVPHLKMSIPYGDSPERRNGYSLNTI